VVKIRTLNELLKNAWRYEAGRRLLPHDVFKWWGKRPTMLIYGLLLDALGVSSQDIDEYVAERLSYKPSKSPKDLTICDPMCGGGTTCIEALFLGAKDVYCSDINPASTLVVNATLKIMSRGCEEIVHRLQEILVRLANKVKSLWCISDYCYVHTFLTRDCDSNYCTVPRWLGLKRVGGKVIKLALTEEGKIIEDCNVTIYEKLKMPRDSLIEMGDRTYAYAAELYRLREDGKVERVFTSLIEDSEVAKHVVEAQKKARSLLRDSCTPIPKYKETRRLEKEGIYCWEELFTPRQLLTLKLFLEEAKNEKNPHILDAAVTMVGTAIRTTSLLAYYYQPYGKINPGLVIKSYWIPKYPAELNPLAVDFRRMKTIGRGTLFTYVRKIAQTCKLFKDRGLEAGSVKVEAKSATEVDYSKCNVVVLDPPYPGKVEYDAITLVYSFAANIAGYEPRIATMTNNKDVLDVYNLDTYANQLSNLLTKIATKLESGGKIYLLLSDDPSGRKVLRLIESRLAEIDTNLDIKEIGSYIGEAPGKLGRSRFKNIAILKVEKVTKYNGPRVIYHKGYT
jgi:adenine-specific DNA methylase